MLAVKLHREKKPWLGKGSYLIPIVSWGTGRGQILNWINILNREKKYKPVRFITLVKIPDSHPVALYCHWIESRLRRELHIDFEFKPFGLCSLNLLF